MSLCFKRISWFQNFFLWKINNVIRSINNKLYHKRWKSILVNWFNTPFTGHLIVLVDTYTHTVLVFQGTRTLFIVWYVWIHCVLSIGFSKFCVGMVREHTDLTLHCVCFTGYLYITPALTLTETVWHPWSMRVEQRSTSQTGGAVPPSIMPQPGTMMLSETPRYICIVS